ncbi:MAG: TatD family hydrolase [Clostridia bacterium]|nr:TatD family hydrolase [Clostridia bacterium]
MNYLDIHAHFADEGYSFPEEWERIRAAGVNTVVLAGDTVEHSAMHRDFCAEHEGCYFCAGVHPSVTDGFGAHTLASLKILADDKKCIAIGEIGYDYHYPETDKIAQRKAFVAQLELAAALKLPVQIHSRDAAADTLVLLKENKSLLAQGFLLHCYSYSVELMRDILDLGGYFSFGGVACFKNAAKVQECVRACPHDRILSETDSPYLSPFRGEKNSPANIPVIVKKLAELRGEDEEALAAQIVKNAHKLFPRLGV